MSWASHPWCPHKPWWRAVTPWALSPTSATFTVPSRTPPTAQVTWGKGGRMGTGDKRREGAPSVGLPGLENGPSTLTPRAGPQVQSTRALLGLPVRCYSLANSRGRCNAPGPRCSLGSVGAGGTEGPVRSPEGCWRTSAWGRGGQGSASQAHSCRTCCRRTAGMLAARSLAWR